MHAGAGEANYHGVIGPRSNSVPYLLLLRMTRRAPPPGREGKRLITLALATRLQYIPNKPTTMPRLRFNFQAIPRWS